MYRSRDRTRCSSRISLHLYGESWKFTRFRLRANRFDFHFQHSNNCLNRFRFTYRGGGIVGIYQRWVWGRGDCKTYYFYFRIYVFYRFDDRTWLLSRNHRTLIQFIDVIGIIYLKTFFFFFLFTTVIWIFKASVSVLRIYDKCDGSIAIKYKHV